ncbi:hypothetical protein ACFLW2_01090 [Chloroflexota bacterium]
MGEKEDKLNELREKLKKIAEERQVNPTLQESKDSSPSFARAVMRGGIKAVFALENEEAREIVIREAGLASFEAFLNTDRKKWDSEEGLPEVFRATMAGVYRGILKLGEEDKKIVLRAMGEACFHRFLWSFRNWEAAGIPMAEGSHDIDSAAVILESGLTVREINRVGDTIFWRGKTGSRYDSCACCLVLSGITEPVAEVCQCASWHMKKMWEYHTGLPMEAQLVETINTGSDGDCVFRVNIKPSQYTAR